MRFFLQTGLLVLVFAIETLGQDAPTPEVSNATLPDCNELFEKAEHSFSRRNLGSEMLGKTEQQLKEVVRLCNETPGGFPAEEQLKILHEEQAEHGLQIANFFLNKSHNGHGGTLGAQGRLKDIIERYPNYSHLDQVLFLLGKLRLSDGNLDEAATYFRRLLEEYPGSQNAAQAALELNTIEVFKISP